MNLSFQKRFAVLIGAGIGLLGAVGFSLGLFESASSGASDKFFLSRTPDPRIAIVAVDDASLSKIGRWPWPRSVHAALIDKLTSAGVLAIGMDVNFPEASNPEDDAALADAIRRAGNVVLPIELPLRLVDGSLAYEPAGAVQPITLIQSAAKAVGHTNTPQDADAIVRRVPLQVSAPDKSQLRSFALEVASVALGSSALPALPTDRLGRLIVNYPGAPGQTFPVFSAADVIQGRTDLSKLRGAIVFVGATAHDLHDEQNVPTSDGRPMSGVEIHASLLDTIVSQRWLREAPAWIEALVLVLIGLLLGILVPFVKARWSILFATVVWIGWIIGAFVAFDRGWLLDIVWPTLVLLFAYGALLLERWIDTEKRRREIRTVFSRYVSGSVVESILKNPAKLKLGGDRRRMSVLFSDLRGFTTLSEGMTPEQLVEVLNHYLHEMTEIVFAEHGVLDKYIGDAVMAFWNAPFDQPDHARLATRAAVRMRLRLAEMNRTGMFPPGITLKVGIGINTGDMVVGNIGGEARYDYTVIGDSVNLASRVEGLNKEYTTEIIVTEATKLELGGDFLTRRLDKVAVKGKKEPITIYQVISMADQASDAERKLAADFEAALSRYFERQFGEAIIQCNAILAIWPDDGPAKNLLERCQTYLASPPPSDWVGTWVMTKK